MLRDKLINQISKYIESGKLKGIISKDSYKISFLAQGEYNINFLAETEEEKYVFRVNTGSQLHLDNQIKYEYDALKALEISKVTPKVFYVDDTKKYFDYGILVMEFLEGRPLEYDKDLNRAANIFACIHSIDLSKIDTSSFIIEDNIFNDRIKEGKRLLKDFFVSPIIQKELKSFFYDFLNWAEKNKYKEKYFLDNKCHVINNTEVNSRNFIIAEEESYLIDWEKPVISDPCQDLTHFLSPTTTLWKTDYILSKEEKDRFLNAYIKGIGGKENDIKERVRLYTPYLYLRALSWCAYAYLEYHKPDKEIKNKDTFIKIKQYLDIDFMSSLLNEEIA